MPLEQHLEFADDELVEATPKSNYTPTYLEATHKYLVAMGVSFAIMLGSSLCFKVPNPWNVVALIVFPVAGFVSGIYFLVKILKIRKNYKK